MGKHKKDKKGKKSKKKDRKRDQKADSDGSNSSWEEMIPKKKKKKKNRDYTSSSSSSSGSEDEKTTSKPQREDWMAEDKMDELFGASSRDYRKEKAEKLAERKRAERNVDIDTLGQNANELNPFWKSGGSGLPTAAPESSGLTASHSDTGQLEWLRRAHRRLREEAEDKGISVEEAAKERWGSLAKLEDMISEAEKKSGSRSSARPDDAPRDRNRRMRRPGSDDEDSSRHRKRFSKPRDDADDDRRQHTKPRRDQRRDHESSWRRDSSRNDRQAEPNRSRHSERSNSERSEAPRITERVEEPQMESGPSTDAEQGKEAMKAEPAPLKVLSDEEMNKLTSKLLKAELIGNTELVAKLRKKVDDARKLRAENPSEIQSGKTEVVVLTKTDSRGVSRPIQAVDQGPASSKKKPKPKTHEEGERLRYFADDDRQSLHQMFEREKLSTASDDVAMFAKMAGKMRVKAGDEDYTVDDAFVEKAARHDDSAAQKARDFNKAVQEHHEMAKVLDSCQLCVESSACPKHLLISIGEHSSLCLPPFQSLVEGHCQIVPNQHHPALTMVDENVWAEVQKFRRELTRMFAAQNMDCVFFETVTRISKRHTSLQCIPVPQEVGEMLPMYFKKAILESETEWAMNKKLVDLSEKGLRYSVPKGLPYFAVDFGTQDGFAHVIEDERDFPNHFGLEIVGGLIDCEPRLWLKQQKESFPEQSRKAIQFSKMWSDYEFNAKID